MNEISAIQLPLEPQSVAAVSEKFAEPAWMLAARQEAWQLYQRMPWPHAKEEAWRRTNLRRFPLDSMHLMVASEPLDEFPPCWQQLLAAENCVSGTLIHFNGLPLRATLRPGDRANGVTFGDLHQALHTHGELIRRTWMQGRTTRPDFNRFTALNAALWHGGTFLHVPRGVRVERPLQSLVTYGLNGGAALHHTLIVAEEGSHVALIQDRASLESGPAMAVEVVEIYAAAGATVRYVSLQHWGAQRYTVSVQNAELAEGANLQWVGGSLGGKMSKEFWHSALNGPQARSLMQSFTFATGDQHIDQSTYQHHRAADTHSDLLFRNVLRDRARTVFYGMIRAEREAMGMEGYQANNNLLLDDAHAHAIPGLEINCNDVMCSHSATTSRLDPQQLFYLQARGLPRPAAERLIVQGFLRPVVDQIPLAHTRRRLEDELLRRFDTDASGGAA